MRATAASDADLDAWTVTYHDREGRTEARLWHNPCVKHVDLPAADDSDARHRFEERHVCGPVTTRWDADR